MTDQIIHNAAFTITDKITTALFGSILDGQTNIIDISYWQDPALIDYDLLASRIDGAILRIAYSAYIDTRFAAHYKNLRDRGVPLGAYHYVVGNVKYSNQVKAVKDILADYPLQLDHYADIEDTRAGTALTKAVVNNYLTYADDAFGVLNGIYTSMYAWRQIMQDDKNHGHRKLWVAHYTTAASPLMPAGWSKWYLWQFTDRARFDAYKQGGLDCSRFNGTEQEWYAQFHTQPTPIEPSDTEKLARLWQAHPELH